MKEIGLGTAMWGWSIRPDVAFDILDYFYEVGGRVIDTANNYPLNSNKEDYEAAVKIISSWAEINKINDLRIINKIGSVSNSNTPKNNLSKHNIEYCAEKSFEYFNENLSTLMIHWDNRNSNDDIFESLASIKSVSSKYNVDIGLSGIKFIDIYENALKRAEIDKVVIEIKSNFLFNGEDSYINNLNSIDKVFWAYGISGSGLKLESSEYRKDSYATLTRDDNFHDANIVHDRIKCVRRIIDDNIHVDNLYNVGMLFSELNENLDGYFVSPSNTKQLKNTLDFKKYMEESDILSKYKNEFGRNKEVF